MLSAPESVRAQPLSSGGAPCAEPGFSPRARTRQLLKNMGTGLPRLSVERARHFTAVFRGTECLPLVLRWARALRATLEQHPVILQPGELLLGRGGPVGRYGIFYPELEGAYFAEADALREEYVEAQYVISPEDLDCLHRDIVPYWVGRTFREGLAHTVSPELRRLLYKDGHIYEPSCIIYESATVRHSLQWVLDYKKVAERGFAGIHAAAEEKLRALTVDDARRGVDKAPFYQAVMDLCLGVRTFALRHAEEAQRLAGLESDAARAAEWRMLADICRHVPWQPARTFHEALQAQWFTQLVSRMEQMHGGIIGNGRMDQYLWPYYAADRAAGRLSDERTLELLDCLWCNIAQFKRVQINAMGVKLYEGHAHWEHTTIGGQLPQGGDATNALTHLILRSWKEFPLDYPDLGVRIHEGTPQALLEEMCTVHSLRKPLPKLLNDEEIVPRLVLHGADAAEALDYCGSGCSEARCINRHTYMSGTTWFNLAAALEMALHEGRCHAGGTAVLGLPTPPAASMESFEALWQAFCAQLTYLMKQVLAQQYVTDAIRTRFMAAPLVSALHDLCMDEGKDINEGGFERGISLGGQVGPMGFATVVDSLCAIRHLVFDTRQVTMPALLEALAVNFEGHDLTRALCMAAPKFGNGAGWVDGLARRLEEVMVKICLDHRNYYGGTPQLFYVPVTSHKAMGRVTGATPDGRRAGDALSEGVSPAQGAARQGPLAVLHSVEASKSAQMGGRAARYLVLPLSPAHVQGPQGAGHLAALVRLWSRQKHWHLQLRLHDADTLLHASNAPEKYRHWCVRLPGYSDTLTVMSRELQEKMVNV